jgi:hypothetical protein
MARNMRVIWGKPEAIYFFRRGLDDPNHLDPAQEIRRDVQVKKAG